MARATELPCFDPAAVDAPIGDAKSPEDLVGLMRQL